MFSSVVGGRRLDVAPVEVRVWDVASVIWVDDCVGELFDWD